MAPIYIWLMEKIRKRWDIVEDWQFLFPFIGTALVIMSSYMFARRLLHLFDLNNTPFEWIFTLIVGILLFFILLRFFLWCFKKLKHKWPVTYRWEMIAIFIVFAVTGTTSVRIGRPFLKLIGVTKDNLQPVFYWVLYIIVGLILYQILLVIIGWLFGQFKFFWSFEKKMLKRLGLGFLLN